MAAKGMRTVGSKSDRKSSIAAQVDDLIASASANAVVESNLIETLIEHDLVSRREVLRMAQAMGVPYSPAVTADEDFLYFVMKAAGTSLRQLRLRLIDDIVPIVTAKSAKVSDNNTIDPFFGYLEVRLSGIDSAQFYPISQSMHTSLATSMYGSRSRMGLSDFYNDFLAVITLDGRVVFINRERVEQMRFLEGKHCDLDALPQSEDVIIAFHDYRNALALTCCLEPQFIQTTLSSSRMQDMHAQYGKGRTDFVAISEECEAVDAVGYVELLLNSQATECFDVDHVAIAALDRMLAISSDKFVLDHMSGELTYNRDEIATVTIPIPNCPGYANSLQSAHYQSLYLASIKDDRLRRGLSASAIGRKRV